MKTALIAIQNTSQDEGWASAADMTANRETMKTMVQTEDADDAVHCSMLQLVAKKTNKAQEKASQKLAA